MSKFFHYSQNNSGGSFNGDYHNIIVEANSSKQADAIAESSTDIYFNGVEDGRDCDCCGDRWSKAWSDGDDEPMIYGVKFSEYNDRAFGGKCLVVFLDGHTEISGTPFR